MHSLNCAESCDIGHAHFHLQYIFCVKMFELLPGNFTHLHQTLHTASVDPSDTKLSKEFYIPNNIRVIK